MKKRLVDQGKREEVFLGTREETFVRKQEEAFVKRQKETLVNRQKETLVSKREVELKQDDPIHLDAFLFTFPMIISHLTLDYVVLTQYGLEAEFGLDYIYKRQVFMILPMFLFIYFVLNMKLSQFGNWILAIVGACAGIALIHMSVEQDTFGKMQNASGVAIIWIFIIMQANLLQACISLIPPALYYFKDHLFGSIKNL